MGDCGCLVCHDGAVKRSSKEAAQTALAEAEQRSMTAEQRARSAPQPKGMVVGPVLMAVLRDAARQTLGHRATVIDLRRHWYPKHEGALTLRQAKWMAKRWRKARGPGH